MQEWEKAITLDGTVRFVSITFTFSSFRAIPPVFHRLPQGSSRHNGKLEHVKPVIDEAFQCSIADFLEDIARAGYAPVAASFRHDSGDEKGNRKPLYWPTVVYCRAELAKPSDVFIRDWRDHVLAAMNEICESAVWSLRVYVNPLVTGGKPVPGEFSVSVHARERKPFKGADGQPVLVWKKGNDGKRIGHRPVRLAPSCHLRVAEGIVEVVPA